MVRSPAALLNAQGCRTAPTISNDAEAIRVEAPLFHLLRSLTWTLLGALGGLCSTALALGGLRSTAFALSALCSTAFALDLRGLIPEPLVLGIVVP